MGIGRGFVLDRHRFPGLADLVNRRTFGPSSFACLLVSPPEVEQERDQDEGDHSAHDSSDDRGDPRCIRNFLSMRAPGGMGGGNGLCRGVRCDVDGDELGPNFGDEVGIVAEPSIGANLRQRDGMLLVCQYSTGPDLLLALGDARVIVEVNSIRHTPKPSGSALAHTQAIRFEDVGGVGSDVRVGYRTVDNQLTKPPVDFADRPECCPHAGEGEGDGSIGQVGVGCDQDNFVQQVSAWTMMIARAYSKTPTDLDRTRPLYQIAIGTCLEVLRPLSQRPGVTTAQRSDVTFCANVPVGNSMPCAWLVRLNTASNKTGTSIIVREAIMALEATYLRRIST
ncbi:BQ5605_C002g01701 [Microbotryum silenes-dioicae]|uniref:BQ5605_C002g01701 protein n=1 Tax=Microbotryum silenes-dioicae TaxID=796604 RepID=A0A2X0M3L1_9BASI|nr:BQ5605_C002g01701 [Microbotryum silenes-dioicae]